MTPELLIQELRQVLEEAKKSPVKAKAAEMGQD